MVLETNDLFDQMKGKKSLSKERKQCVHGESKSALLHVVTRVRVAKQQITRHIGEPLDATTIVAALVGLEGAGVVVPV